jgi:hypothetical protein
VKIYALLERAPAIVYPKLLIVIVYVMDWRQLMVAELGLVV